MRKELIIEALKNTFAPTYLRWMSMERDSLISAEGWKILKDVKRRKKLNEAVDHWKETGSWDKLKNV